MNFFTTNTSSLYNSVFHYNIMRTVLLLSSCECCMVSHSETICKVSSPILKLYAKSRVPFWNHETQVLLSFINWGINDNLIPQIPSENIWCSICQGGLYNTSHTLYTVKRGFNFTSLDCVLFLRQPLMITSLTFTFMITSKQCIYMIVL